MSALVTKLETTLPLEHRIHLWVLDSVYAFLRKINPNRHKAFREFLEGSAARTTHANNATVGTQDNRLVFLYKL